MRVPCIIVSCCLAVAACGTSGVELSDPVADQIAVADESTTTSTTTTIAATTPPTTSTTTPPTTSTTTTTTTTAPPLAFDDEGVPVNGQSDGVVLTPTGWVVPVLETLDDGWRVWTPCGREAWVSAGEFIDSADIVLDPGHGGSESGAVGPAGTVEAHLNLEISRKVRDRLEAAGYRVLMTRDADVRVPIVTRAEIALAVEPAALISIHHNAGTEAPSAEPGTEMFHQIASPESKRLAGLLYEENREALAGFDADWVGMEDAGAMVRENREGGDFYGMLRRPARVPSVISEPLYIANASEEALLVRADVQDALAQAVVDAVDRFIGTDDPGSGFTQDPIFRGYGSSGTGRTDNCDDPVLE